MPVGSVRFRDHAQDSSQVLGMSFSSSLALSEEGCVVHIHGGTGWIGSWAACSAEATTGNKLKKHPSRQEYPLPCSCTNCTAFQCRLSIIEAKVCSHYTGQLICGISSYGTVRLWSCTAL